MLARSGEVKLLDLGLARLYAEGGTSVGVAVQLPPRARTLLGRQFNCHPNISDCHPNTRATP